MPHKVSLYKKSFFLAFFIIIFIIAMTSTTQSRAYYSSTSTQQVFSMYFIDAWYADADGDGVEDDIVMDIGYEIYYFDYYYVLRMDLYLLCPDGTSYYYVLRIDTTIRVFIIRYYFLNHAVASGDYYAYLEGYLLGYHNYVWDEMWFDPPGSNPDDPPNLEYEVFY